jgi:hypothetical protein
VPERTAEFAVGGELEPDLFLLLDQPLDFTILDLPKLRIADLFFPASPALA